MANRWNAALGIVGILVVGIGLVGIAHAEPMQIAARDHVEALCHSWTETPCLLRVGGNLRHQETGRPLVGKRLRFVAGGNVICSATTDYTGRASCLGVVTSGRTVAESGYRILFDGDGPFLANSAQGLTIVKIGATTSE